MAHGQTHHVIDLLKSHHRTLSTSLTEINAISTDGAGVRIALNVYKQILQDGLAILESIINHLAHTPKQQNAGILDENPTP